MVDLTPLSRPLREGLAPATDSGQKLGPDPDLDPDPGTDPADGILDADAAMVAPFPAADMALREEALDLAADEMIGIWWCSGRFEGDDLDDNVAIAVAAKLALLEVRLPF